ncbi:MAG: cellulase family glycosylhydrolase [Kiritimatiellia bacterium]
MSVNKLNPRIGVCTHFERREYGWKVEELLPRIVEAGIGVVRQEIKWEDVEQQKGTYALPNVAIEWLDHCEKAGIRVILLLCYGNPLYDNPLDPNGFAAYARFLAETLRDRNLIIGYEIWNEPTNFQFYRQYGGTWSGADPAPWREHFCELLSRTADAIREVDADTPILTNTGDPQAVHMLKHHPEAFARIDGISTHPYSVRFPPETVPFGGGRISTEDGARVADDDHDVRSLYRLLGEHARNATGRKLNVYATEFGFPSYDPSRQKGWFDGYSERTQAAYSVRALLLALHSGVVAPCLYDFMNDGADPFEAEMNFGLIRHETEDWEPKPVFHAVRRLCEWLPADAEPVSHTPFHLSHGREAPAQRYFWQERPEEPFLRVDGPQHLVFRSGGRFLSVLWRAGRLNGETGPLHTSIFQTRARSEPAEVVCLNLITGETRRLHLRAPTRSGMDGEGLMLDDLSLTGEPLLLRWPLTSDLSRNALP